MKEHRYGTTASLFLYFFRIGFYTFGGGMSIVAQLQKDFVERRQLMTAEDLLDITSVGRSLPGTMIGNVAFLFGFQSGGLLCGLACLLGMILPSMIVLSIVTWEYESLQELEVFNQLMLGVRAAVVPIIASAALKMRQGALPTPASYGFFFCAVALYFAGVNCAVIVLLGGAAGVAACWLRERRAAK